MPTEQKQQQKPEQGKLPKWVNSSSRRLVAPTNSSKMLSAAMSGPALNAGQKVVKPSGNQGVGSSFTSEKKRESQPTVVQKRKASGGSGGGPTGPWRKRAFSFKK